MSSKTVFMRFYEFHLQKNLAACTKHHCHESVRILLSKSVSINLSQVEKKIHFAKNTSLLTKGKKKKGKKTVYFLLPPHQ